MAKRPAQVDRINALGERATAAMAAGDLDRAAALADQALALAPGLPAALAMRASIAVRRNRLDAAERDILAALRAAPAPPPQWTATLAQVYRGRGEFDRAIELLGRAHARDPGAEIIISTLGELLTTTRRHDEAFDLLSAAVGRGADRPGLLAQYARVCRLLGRGEDAIAALRRSAEDLRQPPGGRQQVLFELGLTLDALGRFDEAFDAFRRANALETRGFDIDAQGRGVDAIQARWTRDRLASLPRVAGAGEGLVFIVGMRRSGTTLAEQILAAHPRVTPGGELRWLRDQARVIDPEPGNLLGMVLDADRCTPAAIAEASRDYLARADEARQPGQLFTDKMPANLKLLSLVQLALPAARVVWCRRDAADTCLSCYMQPFNDNSYCADLRTLARYHHDSERLMAHWRRVLDLPIFELHYETLVAEPEPTVRRLLEFLGLPNDDACLRFHTAAPVARTRSTDQVARGLYQSSVHRAEQYRPHLAALYEELERLARERGG